MNKNKLPILLVNPSPSKTPNEYLYSLLIFLKQFSVKTEVLGIDMLDKIEVNSTLEQVYSHVIISGTPIDDPSIDQYHGLKSAFNWVTKTKLPVMGICAGHQIVGYLHGADLIKDTQAENDFAPVKIIRQDPLFDSFSDQDILNLYSFHRDSISLAPDFELLGSSEKCPVHIVKHKTKPMYGLQAHPEKSPPDGYRLVRNFLQNL